MAKKTCSSDGCESQALKGGLCYRHYKEKHGEAPWGGKKDKEKKSAVGGGTVKKAKRTKKSTGKIKLRKVRGVGEAPAAFDQEAPCSISVVVLLDAARCPKLTGTFAAIAPLSVEVMQSAIAHLVHKYFLMLEEQLDTEAAQ